MTNNGIQAIPTRYKGCHFRSRLEARWAVVFDKLEIPWDYEPTTLRRADGTYWIPDFYLPTLGAFGPRFDPVTGCYAEVKGRVTTDDWRNLEQALEGGSTFPNTGILLLTSIPFAETRGCTPVFIYAYWHEGVTTALVTLDHDGLYEFTRTHGWWTIQHWQAEAREETVWMSAAFWKTCDAMNAARSARFEHGESGAT